MCLRTNCELNDLKTESIHVTSATKQWLQFGESCFCVVAATGNLLKYFSHSSLTQKGLSVIFRCCSFHTITALKNTKGIHNPSQRLNTGLNKATSTVCVGVLWFSLPPMYITRAASFSCGYVKTEPEEPALLPTEPCFICFSSLLSSPSPSLPPSLPIFSQDSWTLHKPADSLQNAAVYLTSVELEIKQRTRIKLK